ncbi:hypothetical protein HAX54_002540 [Datura stramonium]|uniref:Disease resistance R13L4/SHOC-2-like LRR domain-containing protein n=1 Tax=Datura stramonium TaxID=4076 RepID=A0ABS8T682_DATST|nr:hypothetical protein [Datura stramonium]
MFFDPDFCKVGLMNFRNVFQHLYVLHLEICYDTKLPDTIGCLYHLKFLRLSGVRELPSSIGNLKNLQILIVDAYSCQLPPETTDLINLRHLDAPYLKPLKRISKLTSLQVLKDIHCDQWKDVDPFDLVNLRELTMSDINIYYSLNNIGSLKNISTLCLWCELDGSFPALEFLKSCQKLHKLWLYGGIEKLPLSDPFPNSITMVILENSKLKEDPMPILGMLPNLRNLKLLVAYEGKEIICGDNSFNQLEFLRLHYLPNLEIWHLATSAIPLIKDLDICRCPKLKEIPQRMNDVERYSKPLKRISKLTSLQVLRGIYCDQWKDIDPVDLVNLQELAMFGIKKSYSLNNIGSLKNLSTLKLSCYSEESFPALEFLSSCQKLHKLWLFGRIEKLPLSDSFPNSITIILLSESKLKEDPMPILGILPNLRNLELFTAYEGKKITCSDNSFNQLEFLRLNFLSNLEKWHLAASAIPLIKDLHIYECPKLKEIPQRMKDVERLKIRS